MKNSGREKKIILCCLLAAGVLIVYGQVGGFDFIRYDEELYITHNAHVLSGLTYDGFIWALTTLKAGNWHPLTWLSLMLDRELYGTDPGGYHWTSVVLHLAGGLVLFLALSRMTGRPWRSGVVAGLFLLHPLHVESVAWVAERKDVLSGLFWMLGLWGYARYAEKPSAGRYLWVVLFFVLGLMSKPMAVTLPFVLLLLDYWPLGRMERGAVKRLLYEKAPLFFLSALSSVITFVAQSKGEAVASLQHLPFTDRLGNAVVSYALYLVKTVRPVDLAFFYPHPMQWPLGQIFLSGSLLALISLLAWLRKRSTPPLAMGWLWFIGTLVPVIGLVQVGSQAMADRYSYIPLIGLFIAAVWGSGDAIGRLRFGKVYSFVAGGLLLAALLPVGYLQAGHWRDSAALFKHALEVTEGNYLAHSNYGVVLMDQGRYGEAAGHFLESIRIRPDFAAAHDNMGKIMVLLGRNDEAEAFYREAMRINPRDAGPKRRFAELLQQTGKTEAAIAYYREALLRKPDDPVAHNNLAVALLSVGKADEAIGHLRRALELKADYGDARNNLAVLTGTTPASLPPPDRPEDRGGRGR
jgi:tetratricopeptide (TPR) repeat protein